MATTLPAPPEEVWAWLAQMGDDRGGWYSWDRLDRHGEPSADRLVPGWQGLSEGQRLLATRDGRAWFTVALLEPNRTLVLRSDLELPSGHSFDMPTVAPPRAYLDGIWAFHLRLGPRGRDAPGGPHPRPELTAWDHQAVRPADGRTGALHHAGAAVPEPAGPRRHGGVTSAGRGRPGRSRPPSPLRLLSAEGELP
ncbi:hypothetical protein LUW77_02920 [Streptomyces radiopugnans]|nr:hypothetical protein LUW77_02920 [Streptomyces radiopugnans]